MKRSTTTVSSHPHRIGPAALALAATCALSGAAAANEIIFISVTTATYSIEVRTTECHDAATANIPGMAPVGVVDGHPSIAELRAPNNPANGRPWSMCKGYANCPSEKWTAAIAQAGFPNPFAPPVATATIWNVVRVFNFDVTVQTIRIHIIILPERPMCLYDAGVMGDAMLNYSLIDGRTNTALWQKNIHFIGNEVGPLMIDGTHWQPVGPTTLADGLGQFDRGHVMVDSFFDVFVDVEVPPGRFSDLPLGFVGRTQLGQQSFGPQGGDYAVVTNTLQPACYANCDGSTNAPALTVADFACFLNRYAAGDTYANCDRSTVPPVLNVADFSCFLNAFAAGCPH